MTADPGVLRSRYQRLLRLYPAAYRSARGEEMLDTLMELARPGQQRPDRREAASLVLGALRARTVAGQERYAAQSWRGVHRLAVLFLLAAAAAEPALRTGLLIQSRVMSGGALLLVELGPPATLVLAVSALLSAAAGRKAWSLLLCLAGTVTVEWSLHWMNVWSALLEGGVSLSLLLLAAAAVATLPRGQMHRAARPWTWLLAVPVTLLAMPSTAGMLTLSLSRRHWLWYGSLLAFLLWTVVDPRVPIAISAVTLTVPLMVAVSLATRNAIGIGPVVPFLAYVLAPLPPLVAGTLRIARTARL